MTIANRDKFKIVHFCQIALNTIHSLRNSGFIITPTCRKIVEDYCLSRVDKWSKNYLDDKDLVRVLQAPKLHKLKKILKKLPPVDEAAIIGLSNNLHNHGFVHSQTRHITSDGKSIVAHWFDKGHQWHCFTFKRDDIQNTHSPQSKRGSHIHYYSYLVGGHTNIGRAYFSRLLVNAESIPHFAEGHIPIAFKHSIPSDF